jgi:hypothetical protein
MGVLRKKLEHTVIQKYFFLEILINVKAGRVKSGARKPQALDRPDLLHNPIIDPPADHWNVNIYQFVT